MRRLDLESEKLVDELLANFEIVLQDASTLDPTDAGPDTQHTPTFAWRCDARGYDHTHRPLASRHGRDPGRRTQCSPVITGL